jgi:hypothetical protein
MDDPGTAARRAPRTRQIAGPTMRQPLKVAELSATALVMSSASGAPRYDLIVAGATAYGTK